MTVSELIAILQTQKPDAEVRVWHWDDAGYAGSAVRRVVLPDAVSRWQAEAGPGIDKLLEPFAHAGAVWIEATEHGDSCWTSGLDEIPDGY